MRNRIAQVLVLVVIAPFVAVGGIAISDVIPQADVILKGSPTAISNSPNGALITLAVASWLTTPPAGNPTTLQVHWAVRVSITEAQTKVIGALGVWFLKKTDEGEYSPLRVRAVGNAPPKVEDLYFEAVSDAQCAGPLSSAFASTVTEKIVLELACGATAETMDFPRGAIVEATRDLANLPSLHAALLYLSEMPGSRQKAIGIGALIAANDPAGIAALERQLSEIDNRDLTLIVAGALRGYWTNTNPQAVAGIGRIATAANAPPSIVEAASNALLIVHTPETLPYIARLLDTGTRNARIDAIMAIISFIKGYPASTPENVRSGAAMKPSPTAYVADYTWEPYAVSRGASDTEVDRAAAFWKDWLRHNHLAP